MAVLAKGHRLALLNLLELALETPGIDPETERRATWLKWHLEGYDPLVAVDRKLLSDARNGRRPLAELAA